MEGRQMYIPECLQMVYFAHQHWKCQVLMGLLNRKVPATQRISKSRDAILPYLLQPAGWDGVQQMHVFLCLFIYCFLRNTLGQKEQLAVHAAMAQEEQKLAGKSCF